MRGKDDGVGFDVLHDAPAEAHAFEFAARGRADGFDFVFEIVETKSAEQPPHTLPSSTSRANSTRPPTPQRDKQHADALECDEEPLVSPVPDVERGEQTEEDGHRDVRQVVRSGA